MANDEDWVQDVRRWYFGGHPPQSEFASDGSEGRVEMSGLIRLPVGGRVAL